MNGFYSVTNPSHIMRYFLILIWAFWLAVVPSPAQSGFTQTVIPGATWTVEVGQGMGSVNRIEHRITCDTVVIDDLEYLRVVTSLRAECGSGGFVREDTELGQVYFISADDLELTELVVADYSLMPGDTFFQGTDMFPLVVEQVRAIEFLGDSVALIDFGPVEQSGFVAGLGSTSSGILPACNGFTRVVGYRVDETACGLVSDALIPFPPEKVRLFPNPVVSEGLTIAVDHSLGEVQGEVFSTSGHLVRTFWMKGGTIVLPISDLPRGLFLVHLRGERYVGVWKVRF